MPGSMMTQVFFWFLLALIFREGRIIDYRDLSEAIIRNLLCIVDAFFGYLGEGDDAGHAREFL
jgi:hypothetical protein